MLKLPLRASVIVIRHTPAETRAIWALILSPGRTENAVIGVAGAGRISHQAL